MRKIALIALLIACDWLAQPGTASSVLSVIGGVCGNAQNMFEVDFIFHQNSIARIFHILEASAMYN
jgi:hypothetical protein